MRSGAQYLTTGFGESDNSVPCRTTVGEVFNIPPLIGLIVIGITFHAAVSYNGKYINIVAGILDVSIDTVQHRPNPRLECGTTGSANTTNILQLCRRAVNQRLAIECNLY